MKQLRRRILVVEDDPTLRSLLRQNLEFEGYQVFEADNGQTGLDLADQEQPDLLVLDLMLPRMSGMEICKRLRSTGSQTPILMLTARDTPMDKVMGLKSGADDYLTKPFDLMELLARVEALLRRVGKPMPSQQTTFHIGDADIDFRKGTITRDGQTHHLKKLERQLLQYFVHHPNQPLSREQIMGDVWEHDELLSFRTIDTHVTHLRKKIEPDPSNPRYIVTIHRVGYKFVEGE